jgi:hypothetical protein
VARVTLTIDGPNGIETYVRSSGPFTDLFGTASPVGPLLEVVGLAFGAHRVEIERAGARVRKLLAYLAPVLAFVEPEPEPEPAVAEGGPVRAGRGPAIVGGED